MSSVPKRILKIKEQVNRISHAAGLPDGAVTILAVSKKQSLDKIKQGVDSGLRNFGENYLQEALEKISSLKDLPITWHFIGPIQSNKCQKIAENFAWVQSVDRFKVAERLNHFRPSTLGPLNICIQVNFVSEPQKSGVLPDDLPELLAQIKTLPNIQLRGLMFMPPANLSPEEQLSMFQQFKIFYDASALTLGDDFDTLSMGMSNDFEQAILAGSTCVRLGRSLFGER